MHLLRLVPFAAAAAVVCATAVARADIPPSTPDTCTLDAQQQNGRQCQMCGASYEAPHKCDALGAQGFTQACRSSGASVWHEVWCRGGAEPPPAEKKSGCGACSVGSTQGGAPLALALAALGAAAVVARRRRA